MDDSSAEENPPPSFTETQVLTVALIGEGILAGLSVWWISGASLAIPIEIEGFAFFTGVLGSLPLLFVSIFLLEKMKLGERIPGYVKFREEMVSPLCSALTLQSALFIALLSGVCEELFFRGALYFWLDGRFGMEVAIVASSLFFAWIHFVGASREFALLVGVYFCAGLYLCLILLLTNNLFSAMVTHSVYNFCAIEYLRRQRLSFEEQ